MRFLHLLVLSIVVAAWLLCWQGAHKLSISQAVIPSACNAYPDNQLVFCADLKFAGEQDVHMCCSCRCHCGHLLCHCHWHLHDSAFWYWPRRRYLCPYHPHLLPVQHHHCHHQHSPLQARHLQGKQYMVSLLRCWLLLACNCLLTYIMHLSDCSCRQDLHFFAALHA